MMINFIRRNFEPLIVAIFVMFLLVDAKVAFADDILIDDSATLFVSDGDVCATIVTDEGEVGKCWPITNVLDAIADTGVNIIYESQKNSI